MNKDGKILLVMLIILCVFFIICALIGSQYAPKYQYEYIDIDNNKGFAKACQFTDKSNLHRSGGQGTPICQLKDGTIIVVKQYKKVEILGDKENEYRRN